MYIFTKEESRFCAGVLSNYARALGGQGGSTMIRLLLHEEVWLLTVCNLHTCACILRPWTHAHLRNTQRHVHIKASVGS